jgi:hypothetical protein
MKIIVNLFAFSSLFFASEGFSQVGIGTTTPNSSSVLDISSTDKGMLIPRVTLLETNNTNPISNPADGLMVYNTADTNDVTIGFYYWKTDKWLKLQSNEDISTVNTTDYTGLTDGATTPIPPEGEGVIVFSDPHFFGWDGTKWVQLDN